MERFHLTLKLHTALFMDYLGDVRINIRCGNNESMAVIVQNSFSRVMYFAMPFFSFINVGSKSNNKYKTRRIRI